MALYDDNPTVCQTRFGDRLDRKAEQTDGRPSQPTTHDDEPFDEERERALIELQLADDDDECTWSFRANLRRLLGEHRRLYELRELIEQVRRETAPPRQIGGAP